MSAVGYEGHIWEELFGRVSFKKIAIYLIAIIVAIVVLAAYFALR